MVIGRCHLHIFPLGWMLIVGIAVLIGSLVLLQGCGSGDSSSPSRDASPTPAVDVDSRIREVLRSDSAERTIKAAIDAGASCAKLFEARNALDSRLPGIPTINANLRGIGCNSSSSVRIK